MVPTLVTVGALLVVFVTVVAIQPAEYCVSRSTAIAAPAAEVFEQVNDLRLMNEWSPWLEPDPQAKLSYAGPSAGVGAAFSWDGNSQVGAGRLTIVESRPSELVGIQLDFLRPFVSTADTEFTFKPEGGKVVVTWTMTGRRNFLTKMFGLFLSMDKMIGGNFEKGLATLRSRLETPARTNG